VNIRYTNPLAAAIASSIVGITFVIIMIIKKLVSLKQSSLLKIAISFCTGGY